MIDINKIIFSFNLDKNKIIHDAINNNKSFVIEEIDDINVDEFKQMNENQQKSLNKESLKETKRYHVFFYDLAKNIYIKYFLSKNNDPDPLDYYLSYIGVCNIDLNNEYIAYEGDSFEQNLEFIENRDHESINFSQYPPNKFMVIVEVDEEEPPKKEFISQEIGTCDVCGRENVPLARKYYNYDIKCACHSPNHFEIVFYCKNCEPKEPEETTIQFRDERIEGEYKYKTYLVPTKILAKLKGER